MSVKGLTREQRYLKSLFFFIYSFTLLKKTNKDVVGILEFTKISWDTTNEFNTLISGLINRDLDKMGEAASNDDKVMTFVTCVICKKWFLMNKSEIHEKLI